MLFSWITSYISPGHSQAGVGTALMGGWQDKNANFGYSIAEISTSLRAIDKLAFVHLIGACKKRYWGLACTGL